jgi:hypothetical protein
MSMQQKIVGTSFTLPNMPILTSFIAGFIGDGMVDLYLLDGADTLASVSNRKPGGPVTAVVSPGAPNVATLMTNGGVNLQGNAYWPEGSELDITLDFTFMWHGSVDIPIAGTTPWVLPIISAAPYTARGFIWYANAASIPSDSTQVVSIARNVNLGVQQTQQVLPTSPGWTYLDKVTFIVRGNGATLNYTVMKDGAVLVDFSYNPDFTQMTTPASGPQDKTLPLAVGATNASFPEGNISVEGQVSYNRRLSTAELILNDSRFKQLRTARGR